MKCPGCKDPGPRHLLFRKKVQNLLNIVLFLPFPHQNSQLSPECLYAEKCIKQTGELESFCIRNFCVSHLPQKKKTSLKIFVIVIYQKKTWLTLAQPSPLVVYDNDKYLKACFFFLWEMAHTKIPNAK